jgi:hypothetical protein
MYNKEKQLEKCNDTDFCHNQITYLVVWPYVFMADNILPYFSCSDSETRSLLFNKTTGTIVKKSCGSLAIIMCIQLDRVSVRPKIWDSYLYMIIESRTTHD